MERAVKKVKVFEEQQADVVIPIAENRFPAFTFL